MVKNRNIQNGILLVALVFFSYYITFGETSITRIEINPLNRAVLYFTEQPDGINSELSSDKLKINIRLDKTVSPAKLREAHSQGIIRDIYVSVYKNFSSVNILLGEKRGYTLTWLPLSQSLMLETFDWKQLSPQEDLYRSGLLAFENNIIRSAKNYLSKAYKMGSANAAGFLGIMLLKEGRISEALEALQYASGHDANIPDFYAALSQAYSLINEKSKADYSEKKYKTMSGLSAYNPLQVPSSPETEEPAKEPVSFLDRMNDEINGDSLNKSSIDSLKANRGNDSTKSIAKITKDTANTTLQTNSNSNSYLPAWLTRGVFYAAFASLLFLIMLISLYLRWRKQQLKQLQSESSKKFNLKFKESPSNISGVAYGAKLYKQADSVSQGKSDSEDKKEDIPEKPIISNRQETTTNAQDLAKLAKEILETKMKSSSGDVHFSDDIEFIDEEKKTNPRLELAKHLHLEQMKLKSRNIQSLSESDIPTDPRKLADVARKLGLEKSSLETKKNLSILETDDKRLSKLAEKFSMNKDEGNQD